MGEKGPFGNPGPRLRRHEPVRDGRGRSYKGMLNSLATHHHRHREYLMVAKGPEGLHHKPKREATAGAAGLLLDHWSMHPIVVRDPCALA